MRDVGSDTLPLMSILQDVTDIVERLLCSTFTRISAALSSARDLIITYQTAEPESDPFRHLRFEEVQILKMMANVPVGCLDQPGSRSKLFRFRSAAELHSPSQEWPQNRRINAEDYVQYSVQPNTVFPAPSLLIT